MPFSFFALVLAWTWSLWGIVALWRLDPWTGPGLALLVAGGAGPPLVGLFMATRFYGTRGLTDIARRLVSPGRIRGYWWAAVLLLVPAIEAAAISLAPLAGGDSAAAAVAHWGTALSAPLALIGSAVFLLLLGPLPEEIGWRGFVLDQLQRRFAPITASVILALAWFAWHLPLFAISGYYDRFGGAPPLALFGLDLLLTSLLITWIYNHTSRSLLGAVLVHFTVNASGQAMTGGATADWIATLLTALVVAAVIARGGLDPRTVSRTIRL